VKDEFHIDVIFRRKTAYCRNVTGEEPIGTIILTTKRCDVEAVLSEYNVKAYRIVWCSSPHQTMQDFCDIPSHYYE